MMIMIMMLTGPLLLKGNKQQSEQNVSSARLQSANYTNCCRLSLSSWALVERSKTPPSFSSRLRELDRPLLFLPDTLPGCRGTGRSVRDLLPSRLFPDDLLRRRDLLRDLDALRLLVFDFRLLAPSSMLSSRPVPFLLFFFLRFRVRSRKKKPR